MIILMMILNFTIEKDFHENSVFWLIYSHKHAETCIYDRAYETPKYRILISTPAKTSI